MYWGPVNLVLTHPKGKNQVGSTILCQHCSYILRRTIHCKMVRRGSLYITWPARSPDLPPSDFFLLGFVKDQVQRHQYVICQIYKKEFMLLSTMSHHRCFITHGSRAKAGRTFPVPLMETMLRFMEHKVKKSQFSVFVAIGFMYRFVLVQKLQLFLLLYL